MTWRLIQGHIAHSPLQTTDADNIPLYYLGQSSGHDSIQHKHPKEVGEVE